jgi:hypothetical protein
MRGSSGGTRGSSLAAAFDTVRLDRNPRRRSVMIALALKGEIDGVRTNLETRFCGG